MGLKNMTLKSGGTIGVTGGTDLVFADDGQTINGGVHLIVPATADYREREEVTARSTTPTLDKNGKFSKLSRRLTFVRPKQLEDLSFVRNTMRMELQVHPETTQAEIDAILSLASQFTSDSDVTAFWRTGSTT